MGAGDGRFVLRRAAEHPEELVLAVDASQVAMREASWRANRSAKRGGVANAVFVASSLERLPAELDGIGSLVTVHFPWGSLLDAATGREADGADRLAALVAPGGHLRLLLSASSRDGQGGATSLEPLAVADAFADRGFAVEQCRTATLLDADAAHSSWGRRLLRGDGDRSAWLLELRRLESAHG